MRRKTQVGSYESIRYQVSRSGAVGRLVRDGEAARVGIYGLQAYGIFKVCSLGVGYEEG